MQALHAAIQKKQFSPAYLLYGEDEFRKEDVLRHLIDAAVEPATRDFNLDQRRGAELDAESLASLLAMPPMMAERRVIVIRDVTALRRESRAALDRYLASPARDVLVVLTAPADAKTDRAIAQLVDAVDCAPLHGGQVPKWIAARAQKLGTSITAQAAELLQDAVGTELSQLAIELDKLAAYCAGGEIDEVAVAAVVGVRREETLGHLLDAVAQRDATRALALVPGILQQPKTTAVFVVMTLTTQMLALAAGRALGLRSFNDYMALLKRGSSNLTGRSWTEAVGSWTKASDRWTAADLDYALAVLLQTDLALKSSRVSSEEQILSSAILAICCGPGGAYRSAA